MGVVEDGPVVAARGTAWSHPRAAARVRLRHTPCERRGEWRRRIQPVLDHHGCPPHLRLIVDDRRE